MTTLGFPYKFDKNVSSIIADFLIGPKIKLREWIGIEKVNWRWISGNTSAIRIIEKHLDKINWDVLSANAAAMHILEKNLDKINWDYLSLNTSIFFHDIKGTKELKNKWTNIIYNS